MEPQFLKQTINIQPEGELKQDNNSPYSFIEWKQRRPNIIEQQASYHYVQYVINWFKENKEKTDIKLFLTKQKYLYLLDQLQLFFTEKEKNEWYSKINLADKRDLALAIPFFAKKLKNIALYYLNLRKKLKNTKLKYNSVGTSQGLKREIYNALFSFLKEENKGEDNLSFVVDIEELYDDVDYFDKADSHSNFKDINIFHTLTEKYYNTKGISLSSDEWLFNAITIVPTNNTETFINSLTSSLLEVSEEDLYLQFLEKYLSENKFITNYTPLSVGTEIRSTTLREGNNVFFYPGSNEDPTVFLKESTQTVYLSSLTLEGSTGGTSLKDSDTIFVKVGPEVKGAWLKYEKFNTLSRTLNAQIKPNGFTKFIFPYPGYGLSSENFDWTGPDTSSTVQYNFLSNELKSAVNTTYWNQDLSTNSCKTILINNTSLAYNGSTYSTNFKFADQIFLQDKSETKEGLPLFEKDGAWLFKFEKAIIPILPNDESKILWPYQRVEKENYSNYLKEHDFNEVCTPVEIQDLSLVYGIGSSNFDKADKIYKFSTFSDEVEKATECSWLSASLSGNEVYKFSDQRGFSSIFKSGEITRFLWTGPTTKLSEIFKDVKHNSDCPFNTNVPEVTGLESQKCSCKQVYYAPLGHPGEKFYHYNEMADFVVEDIWSGIKPFDRASWVDLSGNEMIDSPLFAWYQTQTKVGWGNGVWINGNNGTTDTLTLEHGKTYFYKRAGDRSGSDMPFYSVNFDYNGRTTPNYQWIKAELNEDGEWISTNIPSKMKIYAGDLIKYERAASTNYYKITSELVENKGENKGSIWCTLDYLVSGNDLYDSTYVFWPSDDSAMYSGGSQTPPFTFEQVKTLHWWRFTHVQTGNVILINSDVETITNPPISITTTGSFNATPFTTTVNTPAPAPTTITTNKMIVSFVPPLTGFYQVAVRATDTSGTTTTFTNIPMLTVVSKFREEERLIDLSFASSGFLLEQPLNGWNYNLNQFDTNSKGAKPYWAETYFNKDENTRFKAVGSWGYPNTFLQNYLPDHSPKLSPLMLEYGTVVNYQRFGYSFEWKQPLEYYEFSGASRWCKLLIDTNNSTNLSTIFDSKNRPDLTVVPTTENSDIILSNVLNGFPVEITYQANKSFVWNVSVDLLYADKQVSSENQLFLTAQAPWSNLGNRYNATVATIPILEELYSEADVGGYFLPQHEGASLYINKNFTPILNTNAISADFLTEDLSIHVGGQGRTNYNQNTVYTSWEENNEWMKESVTAGNAAGNTKDDLTRVLQTFVPYEEINKETLYGLIDAKTILNPWSEKEIGKWIDDKNKAENYTGIKNTEHWLKDQVTNNKNLQIDCWTSDIFGNQYGIFKTIQNCSVSKLKDVPGTLWTRLNNQTLLPAISSLTNVFDKFKAKTYYSELTGNGIKTIDCFFDTLMIEMESCLLFCRIEFDYNNSIINVNYDNVVEFQNLDSQFRYEGTWLQTQPKILTVLFTELNSNKFLPVLYKLDLSDRSFTKEFPETLEDWTNIQKSLSGLDVKTLSRAVFSFNNTKQTYLLTYNGLDLQDRLFVIEFEIEQQDNLKLIKTNRFFETPSSSSGVALLSATYPPIVDLSVNGYYSTRVNIPFGFILNTLNGPATWNSISTLPFGCNLTSTGLLTGTIASVGTYFINYEVTNSNGTLIYPLTLDVTP